MTCTKDCKKCIYGKLIKSKSSGICMTPNQTCNGECSKCSSYRWIHEIYRCVKK